MSVNLIQEAVNDYLLSMSMEDLDIFLDKFPDDSIAHTILDNAYLFINDGNVQTAKRMLYTTAVRKHCAAIVEEVKK